MDDTKNEKIGLSLPEARKYLEMCVEEAKSRDWASGISFAMSILDPGIKKLEDDNERLKEIAEIYKGFLE